MSGGASYQARIRLAAMIVADASLSATDARVGIALLTEFYNSATGRCDPSYRTIAAAAGTRRASTVQAAVAKLKAAGWLRVETRPRHQTDQFEFAFERLPLSRSAVQSVSDSGTDDEIGLSRSAVQTVSDSGQSVPLSDTKPSRAYALERGAGAPRQRRGRPGGRRGWSLNDAFDAEIGGQA